MDTPESMILAGMNMINTTLKTEKYASMAQVFQAIYVSKSS